MNNKIKIKLIKIGLSFSILIAGIIIKTAIGMTMGHSLVIAWLGNALVLFPAIGGFFYIWTKYPFNKINGTINENEKADFDRTESLEDRILLINESVKIGIIKEQEAKEMLRKINEDNEQKKINETKIKEYENAKRMLANLLEKGIINKNEYKLKIEQLLQNNRLENHQLENKPKIRQSLVSPRSIYRIYNVLLWISLFYFFGCLIAFGGHILMSIYSHFTPEQLLIGLTLGVSTLFILMIAVFWYLFIIRREIKTLLTSGNCSNKMVFQVISRNFWRPFILTIIFIVIFLFILPYQWI
jgi:hypothetical protein